MAVTVDWALSTKNQSFAVVGVSHWLGFLLCDVRVQDDRDELHCKVCKLYFSSLHNKKEHLLGRQHLQAITGQHQKSIAPVFCTQCFALFIQFGLSILVLIRYSPL